MNCTIPPDPWMLLLHWNAERRLTEKSNGAFRRKALRAFMTALPNEQGSVLVD
jgi:hypothetical protein